MSAGARGGRGQEFEEVQGGTHLCFYEFWKHNREANFNYLSERLKRTLMAQCAIRLEEEEKAKVPAADAEAGPSADQGTPPNPQDPHVP